MVKCDSSPPRYSAFTGTGYPAPKSAALFRWCLLTQRIVDAGKNVKSRPPEQNPNQTSRCPSLSMVDRRGYLLALSYSSYPLCTWFHLIEWCPESLRYHRMGKKSRTPSAEARVVETKGKLFGGLEKLFLPYSLFSFFLSFSSISSSFVVFLLHIPIFFWSSAFFGQRVVTLPGAPAGLGTGMVAISGSL